MAETEAILRIVQRGAVKNENVFTTHKKTKDTTAIKNQQH